MNQIRKMSGFIHYVNNYRYLVEFRKNQWLKTPELERIQEKKLRAIISHAYHNVPFYHKLFDSVGVKPEDIKTVDDLSRIPIITKSQVQRAENEIIAKGFNPNEGRSQKDHTSGSSGKPLTIVYDNRYLILLRMAQERTLRENGCRLFRDSIASIKARCGSQNESKSLLQYTGLKKRYCISLYEDILNQIRLLKRIKPDILMGYPSSIKLLAMALQEQDLKEISPRSIFTFAELLDTDTRNTINAIFGVDMIDHYGSMEGGWIAWECKEHSGYHMNIDTLVIEFIKDNERVAAGERGEIVITNLNLYAMPFIRYKLGDVGVPTEEKCPCGRGLPLMDMIEGRANDFVRVPNGRIFSPIVVFESIRSVGMISHFRIIQEKEDRFTIELVKGKDFSVDTISQIEARFKQVLGEDIQIETKIVDEITREESGKLQSVVSRVKAFD